MAVLCSNRSHDFWNIFYCISFLVSSKGIPVEILSVTPRIIKELPNFTVIYGYDVKYLLNGAEYTAHSLEFYITVLVPGPMIPYSTTGKLLHNGKVSLDKVKTNMTYGVVLWLFAIILLAELY